MPTYAQEHSFGHPPLGFYLSRPRLVKIRSHTTRYRLCWHIRVTVLLVQLHVKPHLHLHFEYRAISPGDTLLRVSEGRAALDTVSLLYCVHFHYESGVTDMVGPHTCPRVCDVRHPETHRPRTTPAWAPHELRGNRWMSFEV